MFPCRSNKKTISTMDKQINMVLKTKEQRIRYFNIIYS